jgi:hypothetical protein
MNLIKRLYHTLTYHPWQNTSKYPVRGLHDTPYIDSYCACGLTGKDIPESVAHQKRMEYYRSLTKEQA